MALTFKEVRDDFTKTITLALKGEFDEDFNLEKIQLPAGYHVIIDLKEVSFINSVGTREWVRWTRRLPPTQSLKFTNCSGVFIDQLNMIDGFVPSHSKIESFLVPYYCEDCKIVLTELVTSQSLQNSKKLPPFIVCEACRAPAELDAVSSSFLKFLDRHGPT
jgi:hypothetical protein